MKKNTLSKLILGIITIFILIILYMIIFNKNEVIIPPINNTNITNGSSGVGGGSGGSGNNCICDDRCFNGDLLTNGVCENNLCRYKTTNCDNGCENNACVSSVPVNIQEGTNNIFISNSLGCSDTITRNQALYKNTPYCSIQTGLNNLQSGDTLYIMQGNYNGNFVLQNKVFTDNINIRGYPGHAVYLSDYDERYSKPNSLWTSVGNGVWSTPITSEYSWQYVYDTDGSRFFIFTDYAVSGGGNPLNQPSSAELFLTRPYDKSAYYNTTSKILYIKFKDININPNNKPIYITTKIDTLVIQSVTVPSDKKVTIENLNFKLSHQSIAINSMTNVVIRNNSFSGAEAAIRVKGGNIQSFAGTKFEIYNNYFNANYRHDWYHVDMKYQRAMEADSIYFTTYYGTPLIHDNEFRDVAGAISLTSEVPKHYDGIRVYNNLIVDGEHSVIEIENYCSNGKWYNNTVITKYSGGVSWAPADASQSETPCEFYDNIIAVMGVEDNFASSTGTLYSPLSYAIKLQYRAGRGMYNWNVHHNTFISQGYACTGMQPQGYPDTVISVKDVNFTNNICYSQKQYAFGRMGMAKDGNFYDYNIYYNEPGSWNLLMRWNNDTNTNQFSTLSAALTSNQWDGTWDIHSKQINPNFVSINNFNFKPSGVACTMSSTGSYVGAVPCK